MADETIARELQRCFTTDLFRVYTNPDVIGCEVGGALKNVIAIASGMADGLGTGDNTRAAVITRGLAELSRLGVALGGEAITFSGLAGMGDLIATCVSQQSRNRYVGEQLGRGRTIDEIIADMNMVAEGVKTSTVVQELADELGLELPIADEVVPRRARGPAGVARRTAACCAARSARRCTAAEMNARSWLLRRLMGRLRIDDDTVRHLTTFQRLGETVEVAGADRARPGRRRARSSARCARVRPRRSARTGCGPTGCSGSSIPESPSFVPRGHLPFLTNLTHRNWTMVGNLTSPWEAIVDPRGLVTPWNDGWSLDWWVGADDRWHVPSREAERPPALARRRARSWRPRCACRAATRSTAPTRSRAARTSS